MARLTLRETDILKQISDWLSWRCILHCRTNSGAVTGIHQDKLGNIKRRFVRFIKILYPNEKGLKFPDMILLHKGVTAYIELKRPKHYKDDPGQDAFLKLIIENGGYAAKIKTLEEMQNIIQDIDSNHTRINKSFIFNGFGL